MALGIKFIRESIGHSLSGAWCFYVSLPQSVFALITHKCFKGKYFGRFEQGKLFGSLLAFVYICNCTKLTSFRLHTIIGVYFFRKVKRKIGHIISKPVASRSCNDDSFQSFPRAKMSREKNVYMFTIFYSSILFTNELTCLTVNALFLKPNVVYIRREVYTCCTDRKSTRLNSSHL